MASGITIPSEFDLELENERSRWLRRRFLWLCMLGFLATIIFDGQDIYRDLFVPRRRTVVLIEILEFVVSLLLYAFAGAYVIWIGKNRNLRTAMAPQRLAFLLVVLVGLFDLGFELIRIPLMMNPQVSPDVAGQQISTAVVFVAMAMLVLFINHFLACLLMPWTFRESLQPAGVLLAAFSLILLFDVRAGRLPAKGLFTIPALAASFIPGAAICWWRFSRFRKAFQLRFESSRYRMLQHELEAARQLHESFLPPQIDSGPLRLSYAYEPMRQIGGDLLFVHRPAGNENVLSAVVLDVTGHGIRAALTVNRLMGELERLFAESPDASPEKIIRGLNHYIALTLSRHTIYATALAIRLDAAACELQWAGGGHPPAFLRRQRDVGSLQPLESSGPLLGVIDGEGYDIALSCRTFGPGDVLIAYTDGVCEASNPGGTYLGTDGTKKLIADACAGGTNPTNWPADILRAVLNYRRTPVEDDTLIAAISLAAGAQPNPPRRPV